METQLCGEFSGQPRGVIRFCQLPGSREIARQNNASPDQLGWSVLTRNRIVQVCAGPSKEDRLEIGHQAASNLTRDEKNGIQESRVDCERGIRREIYAFEKSGDFDVEEHLPAKWEKYPHSEGIYQVLKSGSELGDLQIIPQFCSNISL
jgi:hypothetical protein